MSIISYSQNFEDVLLWRALGHIDKGCYLDIGAQDPVIDSVSKCFYDAGWRGVHVEATPTYAEAIRVSRVDEIVIQAAVCDAVGPISLFEIPGTGLSTGRQDIAEAHAEKGFEPREISVETVTLDFVLSSMAVPDVHWMKIDVEGMEASVLRSWGDCQIRPWILVVESTFPTTQKPTHNEWVEYVHMRGYQEVWFDGLSRYFVSNEHPELAQAFAAPPDIFDGFQVSTNHFSVQSLTRDQEEAMQKLQDSLASMTDAKQQLSTELNQQQIIAAEQIEKLNKLRNNYKDITEEKASLDIKLGSVEAQLEETLTDLADKRQALIDLADKHSNELAAALLERKNISKALEQREADFAERLALARSDQIDLQQKLDNAHAMHLAQIEQIASQHSAVLQAITSERTSFAEKLEQREAEFTERLALARSDLIGLQQKLDNIQTMHLAQIGQISNQHSAVLQAITAERASLAEKLEQRSMEFEARLGIARIDYLDLQKRLDSDHGMHLAWVEKMSRDHHNMLQSIRDEFSVSVALFERREKDFEERIVAAHLDKRDMQAHLDDARRDHFEQLERMSRDHFDTLETLYQEFQSREDTLRSAHDALQLQISCMATELQKGEANWLAERNALEAEAAKLHTRLHNSYSTLDQIQSLFQQIEKLRQRKVYRWFEKFFAAKDYPRLVSKIGEQLARVSEHIFLSTDGILNKDADMLLNQERPYSKQSEVNPYLRADSLAELCAWHDLNFVRCAFVTILGRQPDMNGEKHYVDRLRAGVSKLSIIRDLRQSKEAKRHDPGIAGLDRALRLHTRRNLPVIGKVIGLFSSGEGDGKLERKLRQMETSWYLLCEQQAHDFFLLRDELNALNARVMTGFDRLDQVAILLQQGALANTEASSPHQEIVARDIVEEQSLENPPALIQLDIPQQVHVPSGEYMSEKGRTLLKRQYC
jgi:FkbM family methyltransferase